MDKKILEELIEIQYKILIEINNIAEKLKSNNIDKNLKECKSKIDEMERKV